MFDYIIRNGSIVNGTGKPSFVADIAITDGVISQIGRGLDGAGRNEIDATGLVVAPGFIDIHSHSDLSLFFDSHAESKIRQGVTTEVVGQCGVTNAPVRARHKAVMLRQFETSNFTITAADKEAWNWPSQMAYLNGLVEKGVSSNLIPLVGGVPLRIASAGTNVTLTSQELVGIKELLNEELRAGVWGLSSGLYYVPESHFRREELVELCKVVREHNAIWAVHMRDEGQRLFAAVDEVIDIAHQSRVSLQISHLKLEGKSNWGRAADLLARIDRARAEGVDVHWDQYPYTSISLHSVWFRVDRCHSACVARPRCRSGIKPSRQQAIQRLLEAGHVARDRDLAIAFGRNPDRRDYCGRSEERPRIRWQDDWRACNYVAKRACRCHY